ncbi:arylesterase [Meridianimarinicoccus roseus]|uniref:Arylesterase n=1 Tax=Meridianimarinicoccus roseus TaxID=2072018 RepID=A0A2V2L675_9RHOB|nr:arylesterase [Meridianimarinicoccus roseus]
MGSVIKRLLGHWSCGTYGSARAGLKLRADAGAIRRAAAGRLAAGLLTATLALQPGGAPAQNQDTVTVAALGDSLTQGYGLAQGDGFVPQLQRWLDAQEIGAEVLNAGVSGDTTAGGLSRLGWTLTDDVDALIVALGGNDLLRGIPPETARANLDAILTQARASGLPVLLIGVTAPGNFGPDYKDAFDAIYPELAAKHGALLVPSFLAPIEAARDAGGKDGALRALMQPDGIHPNARGVALVVDAVGPKVAELVARADQTPG